MSPDQLQNLLEKFSRGTCTPEEEKFIISWYEKIGEKEAVVLEDKERDRMKKKMWSAISPVPTRQRNRFIYLTRAAIIVIPLLVCAAAFYLGGETFNSLGIPSKIDFSTTEKSAISYKNDGNATMKIVLTDGTQVSIQPASELIVKGSFGQTKREVELRGEGFFQVAHNPQKPFVVYTPEVVAKVLGTSFNIRAYDKDNEITVAVKTGKVSVYANAAKTSRPVAQDDEVILTPNQQVVYHRERAVISKQLVAEPQIVLPNSKLFMMQFENADVAEIFEVLAENYGVQIRFDSKMLSNCKLTTSMSDEGLYERIEVICKAIGASYSIGNDASITIKGNGC